MERIDRNDQDEVSTFWKAFVIPVASRERLQGNTLSLSQRAVGRDFGSPGIRLDMKTCKGTPRWRCTLADSTFLNRARSNNEGEDRSH